MATPVQQLSKETVKRNEKLRKKFKCFRVLILGRANAGKTTILQKVCNTDEQPEIFDGKGHKASNSCPKYQTS
jgi:septin family protein